MHQWLTIDIALGTLIATSFTSVGLVALWAAASQSHWFLRTAVLLAILAPLLWVPAFEPFLAFAIQAGVVAAGVRLWRWKHPSHGLSQVSPIDSAPKSRFRAIQFSLPTLLWLTSLTAIVVVVTSHVVAGMPPQNSESWRTIVLQGTLGGCVVLLGAWPVASKRKLLAWPVALGLCLLCAAVLGWQDWFVLSLLESFVSWPTDSNTWLMLGWLNVTQVQVANIWLGVVLAINLTVCCVLLLWRFATARVDETSDAARDARVVAPRVAGAGLGMLLLLIGACPAYFLVRLLNPAPIPVITMPEPNGYDDLVVAGQMIENGSPLLNTAVEPKSTEELAMEVEKFSAAFDRIRLGLSRPSLVPAFKFDSTGPPPGLTLENVASLRVAARALMREAELAQQEGRFRDSADISLENMRLGQAATRGCLLIDYLVGAAIEGIAQSTLYPAIPHLDTESCRQVIAALVELDKSREPLADGIARDRIWVENYGWHGHLHLLLEDLTASPRNWLSRLQNSLQPRTQATVRMLTVELALRQHYLEYGTWPDRLDQLAPEFLTEVPADPFDAEGGPLRYVRSSESYLLYSVGLDGDDDGGRQPAKMEYGGFDIEEMAICGWRLFFHRTPIKPGRGPATQVVTETGPLPNWQRQLSDSAAGRRLCAILAAADSRLGSLVAASLFQLVS